MGHNAFISKFTYNKETQSIENDKYQESSYYITGDTCMSILHCENTDGDQILCKLYSTNKIVVLDLQKGGTLREV